MTSPKVFYLPKVIREAAIFKYPKVPKECLKNPPPRVIVFIKDGKPRLFV